MTRLQETLFCTGKPGFGEERAHSDRVGNTVRLQAATPLQHVQFLPPLPLHTAVTSL